MSAPIISPAWRTVSCVEPARCGVSKMLSKASSGLSACAIGRTAVPSAYRYHRGGEAAMCRWRWFANVIAGLSLQIRRSRGLRRCDRFQRVAF